MKPKPLTQQQINERREKARRDREASWPHRPPPVPVRRMTAEEAAQPSGRSLNFLDDEGGGFPMRVIDGRLDKPGNLKEGRRKGPTHILRGKR